MSQCKVGIEICIENCTYGTKFRNVSSKTESRSVRQDQVEIYIKKLITALATNTRKRVSSQDKSHKVKNIVKMLT